MIDELEFFNSRKFNYNDKVKICNLRLHIHPEHYHYLNRIGIIEDIEVSIFSYGKFQYFVKFKNPELKNMWFYERYLEKIKD